ncbi:MAG: ATP-dependent Clp protease adapter ClpS [Gammaproteobacteria bacterium]|nr:ATP-dependent Clp protease adapter ClpS [Gammaproteobacteria bacterium]
MKNEVNKELTTNLTATGNELTQPPLYRVVIHNDDFTPMEFVVGILEKFFFMNRRKAIEIMMEAHIKGKGECGIFTKDIAETKMSQVVECAKLNEHPLISSMEAEH